MSLKWDLKPRMSIAQANQLERVRMDEMIEKQEQTIQNDMKATLRARWTETLEEASEHKRLKDKIKESKREMTLANKALTEREYIMMMQVRRSQLKELLQSEQKQLEQELHSMGLTFYKDRL
ncbi:uncharacterized protein LOC135338388 isoform X1 [Halichondria panicea]|uniref:uncharacterized protein LOC135338388 isoform X1 n=1 Tax=Halichondria panicea TaxID=6063 RepID=UPI00312B6D7D